MIRRLFASTAYFIAILLLLLSSCVAPIAGYKQSTKWFLDEIDPEQAKNETFFVAFKSNDPSESNQLRVTLLRQLDEEIVKFPNLSFLMTEKDKHYSWAGNNANIKTKIEEDGSQRVQIFVMGDTPWSSLSEYRVTQNTIYPLRHAQASPLILIFGILFGLIVVSRISKPLKRAINRFMQVEESG